MSHSSSGVQNSIEGVKRACYGGCKGTVLSTGVCEFSAMIVILWRVRSRFSKVRRVRNVHEVLGRRTTNAFLGRATEGGCYQSVVHGTNDGRVKPLLPYRMRLHTSLASVKYVATEGREGAQPYEVCTVARWTYAFTSQGNFGNTLVSTSRCVGTQVHVKDGVCWSWRSPAVG